MALETRRLGRTGEDVTVLGFGAMELRGLPRGPEVDDEVAGQVLNGVLDAGITLIDTSPDYGRSEELIGRYVGHRRDEFFLASKCGCSLKEIPPGEQPTFTHTYTPQNVRGAVERSLRRLGTDRLDLVQVHISPSQAQMEADSTIETLQTLRDEGKLRFIGMSGTLPHLPDQIAMGVFDVFQIPYSALQREHEKLINDAVVAGAGTLIRGGVARGALTDDKDPEVGPIGMPEGEGRRRWEDSGVAELLDGMERSEFILRFTLSHPGLTSTIVGTSKPAHLAANVAVAEKGPLPADVYEEAKRRLTASLEH